MLWDLVSHFSPKEAWGKADKMNGTLILLLDRIRHGFGPKEYFNIHRGYDLKAGEKSQHRLGNAVDFHISNIDFLEAEELLRWHLNKLQVANSVGLGCYPFWNNPGFHLDVRGTRARWGRGVDHTYISYRNAMEEYRTLSRVKVK